MTNIIYYLELWRADLTAYAFVFLCYQSKLDNFLTRLEILGLLKINSENITPQLHRHGNFKALDFVVFSKCREPSRDTYRSGAVLHNRYTRRVQYYLQKCATDKKKTERTIRCLFKYQQSYCSCDMHFHLLTFRVI